MMLDSKLYIAKFEASVGDQRLAIREERLNSLLHKAQVRPPDDANAHGFNDWVFRLEHATPEPTSANRSSFLARARHRISNVLDRIADGQADNWHVVSCDDGTHKSTIYEASALRIHGRPLRLKPDSVFKHNTLDLTVIFEYKIPTPGVRTPSEGWPNLATQLWAYSWADQWANNPNVLLVGAIFDWDGIDVTLGSVCPRTIKTDASLCCACAALFRMWGGRLNPQAIKAPELRRLLNSLQ